MFTIDQIKTAHALVKSGADFPFYVQDIIQLGVKRYETFVTDGHSCYFGNEDYTIASGARYETLVIGDKSNGEQFIKDLKEHQQGKTDYLAFCRIAAALGVEKWAVDLHKMTCTYYDLAGNALLVESIPVP